MSFETAAAALERAGQARGFRLYAKSLAAGRGDPADALGHLRAHHGNLRGLSDFETAFGFVQRAAVPAGTTTGWGSGLVGAAPLYAAAFLAEVVPMTCLGKLAVTECPSNCKVPRDVSSEIVATWLAEGQAAPIFRGAFDQVTLPGDSKIACGMVISEELARDARPSAERLFSNKLKAAVVRGSDLAFLSPGIVATATHPASITHGVVPIPSTGGDAAAVEADLGKLRGALTAAGFPVAGRAFIVSPQAGEYLGSLRYVNGGAQAFPNASATGGDLYGVPLVTSDGAGDQVVLVHAPSVLMSDDGLDVRATSQGAVEMLDNPIADSGVPTGAASMLSLWQTNSVALMAVRFLNFLVGRPGAVAVLSGFDYVAGVETVAAKRKAA